MSHPDDDRLRGLSNAIWDAKESVYRLHALPHHSAARMHAHSAALSALEAALALLRIAANGESREEEARALEALGAAQRGLWCVAVETGRPAETEGGEG